MNYKVRFYQNNLWEVVSKGSVEFRGNLAECYAWVQLTEKGYFNG